jgi:hypothetical protein
MDISQPSMDTMREIKSRRDAIAEQQSKVNREELSRDKALERSQGVRAFMAWFAQERAKGNLVMSGDHLIDVQPDLSKRFNFGMANMRYFIALPEESMKWFFELPWLHVAIARDSSSLSLVCARSRIGDLHLPEFAMNFETKALPMLRMMCNYHYLDVRAQLGQPHVDESGKRVMAIGRDVLMTMDIRVISGERTFEALLDGKAANGFSVRSITRAKVPGHRLKPLDLDIPKTPLLSVGKAR